MCKCQLQYCTLQSLSLYQNSVLDRSSPAESTECSDESGHILFPGGISFLPNQLIVFLYYESTQASSA